jgi:hypothetical protein
MDETVKNPSIVAQLVTLVLAAENCRAFLLSYHGGRPQTLRSNLRPKFHTIFLLGRLVTALRQHIGTAADLPAGYSLAFCGQFENHKRAQRRLVIVGGLASSTLSILLFRPVSTSYFEAAMGTIMCA